MSIFVLLLYCGYAVGKAAARSDVDHRMLGSGRCHRLTGGSWLSTYRLI